MKKLSNFISENKTVNPKDIAEFVTGLALVTKNIKDWSVRKDLDVIQKWIDDSKFKDNVLFKDVRSLGRNTDFTVKKQYDKFTEFVTKQITESTTN